MRSRVTFLTTDTQCQSILSDERSCTVHWCRTLTTIQPSVAKLRGEKSGSVPSTQSSTSNDTNSGRDQKQSYIAKENKECKIWIEKET